MALIPQISRGQIHEIILSNVTSHCNDEKKEFAKT